MNKQQALKLIYKLRAQAKGKDVGRYERKAFSRKVEELEHRHLGKWSWWRLAAMTIKAKEGMIT